MGDIDTRIDFNVDSVYTLGTVSVIAHQSMDYVQRTFGGSILNLIHPLDPIPMMFGGHQEAPKAAIKVTKKIGITRMALHKYAQALIDAYHRVASFGPIGKYICCFDDELRVLHRNGSGSGSESGSIGSNHSDESKHDALYHQHLVVGASTHVDSVSGNFSDLPVLIAIDKYHCYLAYKQLLDSILPKYMATIDVVNRTEIGGDVRSAITVNDEA